MVQGTLGEFQVVSGDTRGGPRRVEGRSGRSGTGRGNLGEVLDRSGTINEIEDLSGNLGEVQDGSRDPRGGPGSVGGPSGRSGTGRGTQREVREASGNPRGGLARFGGL